ncbi:MAG: sensor histidine kinase [Thermoleophilaceae bacterium]
MQLAPASAALLRPGRADLLIAAAVALLAQAETWSTQAYDPMPAYAAAAVAMTAPLVWRRLAPLPVLAAIFAPLFAMRAAGQELDSLYIMVALILAFNAVGAYCERRRAIVGLGMGLLLLAVLLVFENLVSSGSGETPAAGDFIFLGGILGVVWAGSVALRERSLRTGELEQRADRLERERDERARAAVEEERARIARELHDVVAHSVSVIAVQTGSMRRRLTRERPSDAEELSAVERTAREALAEMRRLLGLLRSDDDGHSLAPQPGMGQLERLVGQVRAAGLPVELVVQGEPRVLPPGVDLAAYRIVQEALTNVLKHAHAGRAAVVVRHTRRGLELEITDDGRGPSDTAPVDGHGLVGMRERVALYGGSLDAGPGREGGFTVQATLPVAAG